MTGLRGFSSAELRRAARQLQGMGKSHDTILAHISPAEAALLRAHGGAGTLNKRTGLRQFDSEGGGEGPGAEGGGNGPGMGADGGDSGNGGGGGGGGGPHGGEIGTGHDLGPGGVPGSGDDPGVGFGGGSPTGQGGFTGVGTSEASKPSDTFTGRVASTIIGALTGLATAGPAGALTGAIVGAATGKSAIGAGIGALADHGVDKGNNPGGTGDPGASNGGSGQEGGGIGPAGGGAAAPVSANNDPVANTGAQARAAADARNATADIPGSYTYGQGSGGAHDFYSLLHPGAANGGRIGNLMPSAKGGHRSGQVSGRSFNNIASGIRAYGMGFRSGGSIRLKDANDGNFTITPIGPGTPDENADLAARDRMSFGKYLGSMHPYFRDVANEDHEDRRRARQGDPNDPNDGVPMYANGGFATANTHGVGAGRSIPHGLVPGASPGRADALHASVKRGSYIMPADVVSALGGGNTANGGHKLNQWVGGAGFKSGAGMPGTGYARGGLVDVRLSSGEYHVPPEFVHWLGKGDPDKGAKILDAHVARIRAKQIMHLRNLPPPK